MKKITPQAFFSLLLFLSIFSLTATAQKKDQQVAIKEWLIANKDKVTLVSFKEYQQMSPSVRAVLDANKQTLVYNQEVTQQDLEAFEQKNAAGTYLPYEMLYKQNAVKNVPVANATTEEEQNHKVLKWLDANQKSNIKIISRQDYKSRSLEERTYIDKLENKIIYEGAAVTLEDIEAFEQKKH